MKKAMTFSMIAKLILIVLGLTVVIVISTTQLRSGSKGLDNQAQIIKAGTDTSISVIKQSENCDFFGYDCLASCGNRAETPGLACEGDLKCCI